MTDSDDRCPRTEMPTQYLEGKMLIAMPTMGDPRFERSLIYLCAHSDEGAMGLIVNKLVPSLHFSDLMERLGIARPPSVAAALDGEAPDHSNHTDMLILEGGPVENGRGFVLHSPDYNSGSSTLAVSDTVSMTATTDILVAISTGQGPGKAIFTLGYSGWSAGQLEQEIQANGWLHCDADDALIFDQALDTKYDRALAKLGIDVSFLSSEAGHA
ncbi:MAG: YqgE/AlgH family protein [Parvibaculum sp.]